jgi:spectinomycin phosphotransferase
VLEPPADLSNQAISAGLGAGYGLDDTEVAFLPLGHDPWAWVYRARAAGGRSYFLMVRRHGVNAAGLVIPRFLQDHGVSRVIAPIATLAGALWTEIGPYALIVYPFVEAQTGMMGGMTDAQRVEYGAVLRQIHEAPRPAELVRIMRRESFAPDGAASIRRIDADLAAQTTPDDPYIRTFDPIWRARREQIVTVLARAEELGRRFAATSPPLVICHADIHTNNVLIDEADHGIWVTDWDEAMLAPRERDVMFAVGGGISRKVVTPHAEALFLRGYHQEPGPVAVDPLGLAYYRYAWAVSDIGSYGEQVMYRSDLGPATREESVERFLSLFVPGSIVALSFESDPGA